MYSILSFRTAKYFILNHKKSLLEIKSDASEGHIANGGFKELETGVNYRPEHRGISTPNFSLIQ